VANYLAYMNVSFSVENMHSLCCRDPAARGRLRDEAFSKRAESLYDENLSAVREDRSEATLRKIMVRLVAVFRSYTRSTISRARTT